MIRERVAWAVVGALALAVAASLAGVVESGPLDPGSAPSSTDSVRLPGTPITDVPVTLGQPGHYYLTRNLSSASGGISIIADGVTLDLNGFTLSGPGATGTGIDIGLEDKRTVIRNGVVRNWEFGIRQLHDDDDGVETEIVVEDITVANTASHAITLAQNVRLRNCTVLNSGGRGINILSGPSLIENCSVAVADDRGIAAGFGAIVRNCDVTGVTAVASIGAALIAGSESVVESCRIHGNSTEVGINLVYGRMSNITVEANTFEIRGVALGAGSVLRDCTVRGNTTPIGIFGDGQGVLVRSCAVEGNSGTGISMGADAHVRDSAVGNNDGDGIVVGLSSRVEGNAVADNGGDGIEATSGSRILGNVLRLNGTLIADGAGIHLTGTGNYVEDNDMSSNDIGIKSDVAPNVIVHNSARNHTGGHYVTQAGDLMGVLITTANEGTSSVPHWNDTP